MSLTPSGDDLNSLMDGLVRGGVRLLGTKGELLSILKPIGPASAGCVNLQGVVLKAGYTGVVADPLGNRLEEFSSLSQPVVPGNVVTKTLCLGT